MVIQDRNAAEDYAETPGRRRCIDHQLVFDSDAKTRQRKRANLSKWFIYIPFHMEMHTRVGEPESARLPSMPKARSNIKRMKVTQNGSLL